jgi:hypothetical protein
MQIIKNSKHVIFAALLAVLIGVALVFVTTPAVSQGGRCEDYCYQQEQACYRACGNDTYCRDDCARELDYCLSSCY